MSITFDMIQGQAWQNDEVEIAYIEKNGMEDKKHSGM